jgi:ketosteroid isomerase-like protein
MSEGNADLLRRYFEAANRRDFRAVMAMYAEDVEMVVPAGWINGGTYAGKEAVGRFFGDWYRTFDGGPQFELRRLCEAGDAVAVAAHASARGGRSGVELSSDYFYVFRVRNAKVSHVQFYDDWTQALEAAELAG